MQTRKVTTYGRRSIAIVPASTGAGLLPRTPARAPESDSSSDSLTEISAGLVMVSPSPIRPRVSPVAIQRSKILQSKPGSSSNKSAKKENLFAGISTLSITSPAPVAKPRKRKPLLVPSPKLRGSPKQSRIDKKIRTRPSLAKVSTPRRVPLQRTDRNQPPKQAANSAIEISDDENHSAPNKQLSTRPPSAQTRRCIETVQASESVLVMSSDSSCSETHPTQAILPRASNLSRPQPLLRQNAILGTPPQFRRSSAARLGAGSHPRLSFGVLENAPSPRPTSPLVLGDDLPSPVDSDDELAFLNVAAELESKPAPPLTVRTRSEPKPVPQAQPKDSALEFKAPGGPSRTAESRPSRHAASTSSLKSLPRTTKPLPPSSKPSIVFVEIPVPKKSSKLKARSNSVEKRSVAQPSQVAQAPSENPSRTPNTKLTRPPKLPKPDTTSKRKSTDSPTKITSSSVPDSAKLNTAKPPTKTHSKSPSYSLSIPYSRRLRSLLEACSQPEAIDLDAFVATFSTDDVHTHYPAPSIASGSRRRWRKIGEASYSEVFGLGGVVVKVIPLKMELDGWNGTEGPCVSEMADVEKEIAITRAMGEIQEGFIKLAKAYVARGSYPLELLNLWDAYDREFGSESIRPDSFLSSQLYVLLILPDGGLDLEHYSFAPRTSWRAAAGIFWQVAQTLARAESLVRFEHRDLHWGQILVQNVPPKAKGSKSKSHSGAMDSPERSGVRVTLIDLGLSRMDTHTRKAWFTELEPEIFEGEGDHQFDVYRMMKAHCLSAGSVEGAWEEFRPLTNVMWLHYLAHKLLRAKGLRKPDTIASRYHTIDDVEAEVEAFSCLVEVEKVLAAGIIRAGGPAVSKVGGSLLKKAAKGVSGSGVQKLATAQSVIRWGAEKRWVYAACGLVEDDAGVMP